MRVQILLALALPEFYELCALAGYTIKLFFCFIWSYKICIKMGRSIYRILLFLLGTLKLMFYGTFGVALVSTVSLIVVCCRWRRQTKTVKKLQKRATTLSNPYVNNPVVGFPSPLRLSSFVNRPESPYDMPEPVGTIQQEVEVSYVSVIDRNESESHYAAVTGNGTANCYADNESRDNDPLPSPAYTNASVFEMDPYEALMPENRTNENPYTSLITRDENEENKEDEVNEEDGENEATI